VGFRGLSFDPNNQYSVPYQWGTTGIVYRQDLTGGEISQWSDLWDPKYQGKVGLWRGQPREVIGLTLKMLGFSANSENPDELAAAMRKLEELGPNLVWVETIDPYTSAPALADGRLIVSMGYAYDQIEGDKENSDIRFVLPEEGTVLWGEHFTIPSTSTHSQEAEQLINYLIEPQVMAEIASYNLYAIANDGAFDLLSDEIRNNPLIFPPNEMMVNSEIILSISPEAEIRYQEAWQLFTATYSGESP
jgi:spermidine/putrescine transport system substrate-binding protein